MIFTKKVKQTIAILATILIVFTVIVFVIPFHKGGTFWIAYLAELVAIAAQIPIFKLAYDNAKDLKSRVLGFPIFRVGYLYLVIQTVASVILFVLSGVIAKFPVWIAVIVCLVILAFALVGSIATDIAREEVERIETTIAVDTAWMKQMRVRSAQLVTKAKDDTQRKMLEQLAEDFRYSDPVSHADLKAIEGDIEAVFQNLEQILASGGDPAASVEQTKQLLAQRNTACKLMKN
ncbi:MAG: hypothetical protein LUG91_08160 [Ruminococcus sp.]|nr:hypothetical protein [Ruminococcus sp.]